MGSTVYPEVDTALLREALESELSRYYGWAVRIANLERRPSWHWTSFTILELDIVLNDGTSLALLFKDLNWLSMPESVQRVKPRFLYDPLREIETYRQILGPNQIDAPICYGAVVDPDIGRYWLFLERATETELHNMGTLDSWLQVARWLARVHDLLRVPAARLEWRQAGHLLCYDGEFLRLWMNRALEYRGRPGVCSAEDRQKLEWLALKHSRAVDQLVAMPPAFLHGEFYASNILVWELAEGLRVRPVDWEMAAVGPGLLDVAALAAGNWTEDQKDAIALAYREALNPHDDWPPAPDQFLNAFRLCRLHVAIQWLGWASEWKPPADFTQDWMGEALRLAQGLER
jgi:hypothetical protein